MSDIKTSIHRNIEHRDTASAEPTGDPAQLTAQAFLDELKAFSDALPPGARFAVCLPTLGSAKLFVQKVTVRAPEAICITGLDIDGLPFTHVCHYSQFSAHLTSYRIS